MSSTAHRQRQRTRSPNNPPLRSAQQRQSVGATLGRGHPGTLSTIVEGFRGGYLGQVFTRNPNTDPVEFICLDETEVDLLLSLISRGGHNATLFIDDDKKVVGCWLCDCPRCEPRTMEFVRLTRISLLAEAERAKSYKFDGDNNVKVIVVRNGLPTSWPGREAFDAS
jgi:hypothetical protein